MVWLLPFFSGLSSRASIDHSFRYRVKVGKRERESGPPLFVIGISERTNFFSSRKVTLWKREKKMSSSLLVIIGFLLCVVAFLHNGRRQSILHRETQGKQIRKWCTIFELNCSHIHRSLHSDYYLLVKALDKNKTFTPVHQHDIIKIQSK